MSEHDVGDIVTRLTGVANMVRAMLVSAAVIGGWVATIEIRTAANSVAISSLSSNDINNRLMLKEMSTDIRYMRMEMEKITKNSPHTYP